MASSLSTPPLGLPGSCGAAEDSGVQVPDIRYARSADGTHIAYQVAGDGDRGERDLKGLPDRWHLYRAVS
jgi:hypothetical protein